MKKIFLALFLAAFGCVCSADYLYWQVDSDTYSKGGYSYAQLYSKDSGGTYTVASGYYDVTSGFVNETVIDTTLSYCIKLGNLTGTGWEDVAMSSPQAVSDLSTYISSTQRSAESMMSSAVWTGGTYTASPEPSSALLLLFGLAGLGLKRKHV